MCVNTHPQSACQFFQPLGKVLASVFNCPFHKAPVGNHTPLIRKDRQAHHQMREAQLRKFKPDWESFFMAVLNHGCWDELLGTILWQGTSCKWENMPLFQSGWCPAIALDPKGYQRQECNRWTTSQIAWQRKFINTQCIPIGQIAYNVGACLQAAYTLIGPEEHLEKLKQSRWTEITRNSKPCNM